MFQHPPPFPRTRGPGIPAVPARPAPAKAGVVPSQPAPAQAGVVPAHAGTQRALIHTSTSIGGSLFLCAISTAIGFFAFIPTAYTGVAELGWISGFGMLISFAITLTVIPALLSLLPFKPGAPAPHGRGKPAGCSARRQNPRRHGFPGAALRPAAYRLALRPQPAQPARPGRRRRWPRTGNCSRTTT